VNSVHLVGNLATEIRVQHYPGKGGSEIKTKATFLLAVSRGRGRDAKPDWVPVETWNKQAETVAQYCRKGVRVAIEGRISSDFYRPSGQQKDQIRPTVVARRVTFLTPPQQAPGMALGVTPEPAVVPQGRRGQ
jgi:single-strand DNA-binding protein